MAVVEDFVAVARYFEAFSVSVHSDYGYVCESYLVDWLGYSAAHDGEFGVFLLNGGRCVVRFVLDDLFGIFSRVFNFYFICLLL